MIYLTAKRIEKDDNIISLQLPKSAEEDLLVSYMYDRDDFGNEVHGVDCTQDDVAAILAIQDPECEVTQVTHEEIEVILKASRWYHEIDARVVAKIKERYDINRELSIVKLGSDHADYIAMQAYIDQCRAEGDIEKRSLGLKLPEEDVL